MKKLTKNEIDEIIKPPKIKPKSLMDPIAGNVPFIIVDSFEGLTEEEKAVAYLDIKSKALNDSLKKKGFSDSFIKTFF